MASAVSNINMTMNTTQCVVHWDGAQYKYEETISKLYGENSAIRFQPAVFFYTVEKYLIGNGGKYGYQPSDSTWHKTPIWEDSPGLNGREYIEHLIATTGDWEFEYQLQKFYTSTGIFVCREFRHKNKSLISFEAQYRCNFRQPCILDIDDFIIIRGFIFIRYVGLGLSIEEQLETMVNMNSRKHMENVVRMQQRMEKQEIQLDKMKTIISDIQLDREMMKKQIQQMKWKLDITYFYVVLLFIGVLYIL
jgi:hypothetical protein